MVVVKREIGQAKESIQKVENKLEGMWNASCQEGNNVILCINRLGKGDCPGAGS